MKRSHPASFFRPLLSFRVLLLSLIIAFLYITILIYSPNYRLVFGLITNDYPIQAKLSIMGSLFIGGLSTQNPVGLGLLLVIALLIGLNVSLARRNYTSVRTNGRVHLAVGGSMVLGFVSTSCAVMCGFSLLPLIGTTLGASFSILDGILFRSLTVLLLVFSLYYTLYSSEDKRAWLKKKNA